MSLTHDRNDPRLRVTQSNGQHETYLVLSDEERAKGWVRPLRTSYIHVGVRPRYPTRDLTPEQQARWEGTEYVQYEEYSESESPIVGRFWTKAQLESGCGTITTMGTAIAETYARDPTFYGATFCCGCGKHLPLEEFEWVDKHGIPIGETVGS